MKTFFGYFLATWGIFMMVALLVRYGNGTITLLYDGLWVIAAILAIPAELTMVKKEG